MSENHLIERFYRLIEIMNVTTVSIMGMMQTGKTNTAYYLINNYNGKPYSIYIRGLRPATILKILEEERDLREYDHLFIVLDDVSFILKLSKESERLANFLTRIYHQFHVKTTIFIIFHYSTAVMPFFRISQVRILSYLTTLGELEAMKEFFSEPALYQYYNFLHENDISESLFYHLWSILGEERILKLPVSQEPQFNEKYVEEERKKSYEFKREDLQRLIAYLKSQGLIKKYESSNNRVFFYDKTKKKYITLKRWSKIFGELYETE